MKPESWDEALDLRRYWWLLAPAVFALLTGMIVWFGGGDDGDDNGTAVGRPEDASERVEQTLSVGEAPLVAVDNVRGDVTVVTGEEGRVRVVAERQGEGRDLQAAQDALGRLELRIDGTDEGVAVVTRSSDGSDDPAAFTRLLLEVPASARLRITTTDGTVFISGVEGDLEASARYGNIDVSVESGLSFRAIIDARSFTTEFDETRRDESVSGALTALVGDAPYRAMSLFAPEGSVTILRE